MNNNYFLNKSCLIGLIIFAAIPGCGRSIESRIKDVVPEFAFAGADAGNNILVVSEGIVHEFTRRNSFEGRYDGTSKINTPWPGRVLSMASIKGTDTFIAVVFDINSAKHGEGTTDYKDSYSLNSFRIKNGEMTDMQVVQIGVVHGQFADDSQYVWVEDSGKKPSQDCYRYFRVNSSRFQLEEGRQPLFSRLGQSDSYCAQSNLLLFCTTSNLPFLINQYGHVVGRFILDNDFEFGKETLEDPGGTTPHKESVTLEANHNSVDCTNDEKFLANVTDFSTETRIAIWNRVDGNLLFVERLLKTRSGVRSFDRVSCRAIDNRAFCFIVGTQLNIVRLDSLARNVISAKLDGEKYTGVSVLRFQSINDKVKATCILTPVDSKCVREIEFTL